LLGFRKDLGHSGGQIHAVFQDFQPTRAIIRITRVQTS
jgi:hypothetical protein